MRPVITLVRSAPPTLYSRGWPTLLLSLILITNLSNMSSSDVHDRRKLLAVVSDTKRCSTSGSASAWTTETQLWRQSWCDRNVSFLNSGGCPVTEVWRTEEGRTAGKVKTLVSGNENWQVTVKWPLEKDKMLCIHVQSSQSAGSYGQKAPVALLCR